MTRTAFLLPLTTLISFAGEPEPVVGTGRPDALSWLTPSFDVRTRYEFRDTEGLASSHALTTRARAGLLLGDLAGFSAFGEIEATGVLIGDYRSNPTGNDSTEPHKTGHTPISDPQNAELNQAWMQWQGHDLTARLGRQRIIRHNAAFIGNVGWRQNEQTYDAISFLYKRDDWDFFYAYADRVQRIFGDDANDAPPGPPLRDFEGDFHFMDGSYDFGPAQVGTYAFLIDVDNNGSVGRSHTFGTHVTTGPLYAELAYQDGSTTLNGVGHYEAWYGHAKYTTKIGRTTCGLGVEYLEDRFKTPLATVHAFNGFADAFTLQRIGLNDNGGAYDGIADLYLSCACSGLPFDITFKGFLHWFLDDGFDDTYGYEADVVLVKKFSEHVTGIVKGAFFFGESGNGYTDIAQLSLEANIKF